MKNLFNLGLLLVISFTSTAFGDAQPTQTQQLQLAQQQIYLLESALAPATSVGVVKLFAKAMQSRNGAVQYMLFCDTLQQQYLSTFQQLNWVSGTSSPNIASYTIQHGKKNKFTITYQMSLQNKSAGTMVDELSVLPVKPTPYTTQNYCIATYTRIPHLLGSN